MIVTLGLFFLVAGLSSLCFTFFFVMRASIYSIEIGPRFLRRSSLSSFLCISCAFGALMTGFVISDFSIANVAFYSHTQKPFLFKLAGLWGNHEGSMLLWLFLLSGYSYFFTSKNIKEKPVKAFMRITFLMQHAIVAGFIFFIILTSNPFVLLSPVPLEGNGLNPLLQDTGLAIHPPFLYMGLVGWSLVFSSAFACLYCKHDPISWARYVQPWIGFIWGFLTLGIGLGSWWAYRELGWGGFWFWDPVENISLLPWMLGILLIHTLRLVIQTKRAIAFSLLLGLFIFSLILFGLFLVRSGVLISVHSFAQDSLRGSFILIGLMLCVLPAFYVYARNISSITHASKMRPKLPFYSKETSLLFQNLLLTVSFITLALGTFYPFVIYALYGDMVSVGPLYYNTLLAPITVVILLFMALGSTFPWSKTLVKKDKKLFPSLFAIIASMGLFFYIMPKPLSINSASFIFYGMIFTSFLVIFSMMDYYIKNKSQKNIRQYAMLFSHVGAAFLCLSLSFYGLCHKEIKKTIMLTQTVEIGSYTAELQKIDYEKGPNYFSKKAFFILKDSYQREVAHLSPEIRFYPTEKSHTTESALYSNWLQDIYIVIGEGDDRDIPVRAYINPSMRLLWVSVAVIALGGFILALPLLHRFMFNKNAKK